MARYPGAVWRPLGEQTEPRITHPDIVCLHTMVGYLSSTDAMFKVNGYTGTESHFGVGGIWGKGDVAQQLDGVVYQWQDTRFQADANGMGNDRLISIETADNAPKLPRDIAPWTPRQVDALVDLVAWCCREHDIPAVLIPDSRPGRRGIGYHRLGCDPWRVAGGELWSDAYGKECPGSARIDQIKTIIVPRVAAALDDVRPDVADEGGNGMWLAWIKDAAGVRVHYYGEPAGKRRLDQDDRDRLAKAKAAVDLGEVPASFLNKFPTYVVDGTHGGSTDVRLRAADDVPAGGGQ